MAWTCHGKTNADLVARLGRAMILTSAPAKSAFAATDRALYCLPGAAADAYRDSPAGIGYGATISAPHMHAAAVEQLMPLLRPGARVLDVGAGSGYLCAVLARVVNAVDSDSQLNDTRTRDIQTGGSDTRDTNKSHDHRRGLIVGVEHIPQLTAFAKRNLDSDFGPDVAVCGDAEPDKARAMTSGILVQTGDGRLGDVAHAPFDAIHVGAAAPAIPQPLIDQLAAPGRMLIPVGPEHGHQNLVQVDKDAHGNVSKTNVMGVIFVPLTDKEHQLREA